MFPKRPGRLRNFSYKGFHRYSLTICTHQRKTVFCDAQLVGDVLGTIRHNARDHAFENVAHCFMPDHIHLIARGTSENADLQAFMARWKQIAGFDYKRATGNRLWQESYFDHVLRDDEETWRAVKYILENPVRKGLVEHFKDYPFCGSDVYTLDELNDLFWKQG